MSAAGPAAIGAAPVRTHSRMAAAFQLPRALRARQLGLGPHQRAPNLLVAFEARVRIANDGIRVDTRLEHEHGVYALAGSLRPLATPTAAESRTPGIWFTTRSTSSGKTFNPSGVTITSFLRPRMNSRPSGPISPMSPVWNQPPSNAFAVSASASKVAAGDVLAPHEDLAVRRDHHVHAGDRLADRSRLDVERMCDADDRRRLRQAVSLNHREPAPRPEGLELGVERRGTDHEAPELESKQPMKMAVPPPSEQPGLFVAPAAAASGATRSTWARSTSRIFGTDTSTDTRRRLISATMSAGL